MLGSLCLYLYLYLYLYLHFFCCVFFVYADAPLVLFSSPLSRYHLSNQVTAEDVGMVEAVQEALQGGAYASPGCLSPRHEAGVGYFQGRVRAAHQLGGLEY
jgi:hypothetical protein